MNLLLFRLLVLGWVFALTGMVRGAGEWPQFRGPDGQGHSDELGVPIDWSETKNIIWKVAILGAGNSSPVVSGNQIWMTSAEVGGKSLWAICVDSTSGKILHKVEVLRPREPGPTHRMNGYASPTPVLDGDRVYVNFGPQGTVCLDTAGRIIWKNTGLKYNVVHGGGSSPVLQGDRVILTCDGIDRPFTAALDKRTGKLRWRQPRSHLGRAVAKNATMPPSRKTEKMAYSTPLVQAVDGVPQLVSSGAYHAAAYDPQTGREIWWLPYTGYSIVGRPSYGNELFYVVGSVRQDVFCVYAVKPGRGRLKAEQIVWQNSRGIGHIPSPILVGKELFVVNDGGVAACLDALTGKELWRERLGGNYNASPVEIRGRLYFCSREGKTTVLAAGRRFEIRATNQLDGTFKASPAVADGSLFLRSDKHLYRIGRR